MELDASLKAAIAAYRPSDAALQPIRTAPLLFTVGITAAGKNALLKRLVHTYPNDYSFLISHTSRAPRKNHDVMEQNGVEYHFVDIPTVRQMVADSAFIEVQVIHSNSVYGSSIAEVQKAQSQGRITISDLDVQGINVYVQLGLNVKPVFVLPPSYDIWMKRLLSRYDGKPHMHDLTLRMRSAVTEIEHALTDDHYYIVINDDLEKSAELVHEIAHGAPVEPHYPKAMAIAEQLLQRIREELRHMI